MNLSYFDLHCDTLFERYRGSANLQLDRDGKWQERKQIYAVWSDHSICADEAYRQFFEIADTLPQGGMLAVEGGELLGDDISRLDAVIRRDIKYFTLVWRDECPIGGAWNTQKGLTPFGRGVVRRLDSCGVFTDLSHASDKTFWDTLDITDRVIATHSDSRAVCDHKRNLDDEMFTALRDIGSLVGISLYPHHLSEDGAADSTDVIRHIEHYMELGGQRTVCLGCDFDGIEVTPSDITCPADLYIIADRLARENYSDELIRAIFYDNANTFFLAKDE